VCVTVRERKRRDSVCDIERREREGECKIEREEGWVEIKRHITDIVRALCLDTRRSQSQRKTLTFSKM
jgi:hypothetical protein